MRWCGFAVLVCIFGVSILYAQSEQATTFTVTRPGVSFIRTETTDPLPARFEGIIAAGDTLLTNERGWVSVSLGERGMLSLLSHTTFTLNSYQPMNTGAAVHASMSDGVVHVATPPNSGKLTILGAGKTVTSFGGELMLRVIDAQLAVIALAGDVRVDWGEADVDFLILPDGYGLRVQGAAGVSDVVAASSFPQLDAALDGCTAQVLAVNNRRLPVYSSPTTHSTGIGAVSPFVIERFFGVTEGGGWYRIAYKGGFGWVQAGRVRLGIGGTGCVGLRVFADDYNEPPSNLTQQPDTAAWAYCVDIQEPPANWTLTTVEDGQSLFELAQRDTTTVTQLALYNCIADPTFVIAGTVLYVPAWQN